MRARIAKRTYQPIWTPLGEDPGYPYQRPSEERYGIVRELAECFRRPFSVLDIGSNYGYFDVRLMGEFDCTCVLVDNKFVAPILRANDCMDRAVVIQKHLSAATLEALSRSEHFDVVLGLAVLHHFDEPERAYRAIRRLGWWTMFEIPGDEDLGAANPHRHEEIHRCFDELKPDGYFPSHVSNTQRPYYVLENEPYIFEQSMDAADRGAPVYQDYRVECDFEESWFVKGDVRRPFVPGMNAWNFMRLGGIWPDKDFIEREIARHKDHPDPKPWNFVLGKGVTAIDLEAKE